MYQYFRTMNSNYRYYYSYDSLYLDLLNHRLTIPGCVYTGNSYRTVLVLVFEVFDVSGLRAACLVPDCARDSACRGDSDCCISARVRLCLWNPVDCQTVCSRSAERSPERRPDTVRCHAQLPQWVRQWVRQWGPAAASRPQRLACTMLSNFDFFR